MLDIAAVILDSPRLDMTRTSDAFERALEEERRRNARSIAAFRFYAGAVVFALNLLFTLAWPRYIGPPLLWGAVYCVVAALLWLAHSRLTSLANWTALSIPLIDMPFVLSILWPLSQRLHAEGFPDDAGAVSCVAAWFFPAFRRRFSSFLTFLARSLCRFANA